MDTSTIILLMFGGMLFLLFLGMPIGFALGAVAMFTTMLVWPYGLFQFALTAYTTVGGFIMVSVPLFIMMGEILRLSGVTDDLYAVAEKWVGKLPGGIASTTVLACGAFGAVVGIGSAGTATMGLISLPAMEERKYNRKMATGAVASGGALGIIIPPSIVAIIYGSQSGDSIGKLFIGGVGPGILMILLFIGYITLRCITKPEMGPPGPTYSWRERFVSLLKLFPVVLLIFGVLGTIYAGMATPTEAASIGAVGSLFILVIYKKLKLEGITPAMLSVVRTTCMIFWILIGSVNFAHLLSFVGASDWINQMVQNLSVSPWIIIISMQFILIILGMFLDPMGIIMITVPIFVPIVKSFGFDSLWFGILFMVNMGLGYITPPFGFNLFILRGIAPIGVTMGDIYRGIIPFSALIIICLILIMIFPEIAVYLPERMMR